MSEAEMLEALHMGTLEIQIAGCGSLVNYVPEFGVATMPFLFSGYEEAYALLDGPLGDLLKEAADKKGFKVLSFTDLGFAQITNNSRPVNHPKDLDGIKMRCPCEPQLVASMKQLGAKPSTLAFSELYLALDQGVVDGQFNPVNSIYETKFHEVQDYLSFVNMFYYFCNFTINKNLYDSLDASVQEMVNKAAIEASIATREVIKEKETQALAKMKNSFKNER